MGACHGEALDEVGAPIAPDEDGWQHKDASSGRILSYRAVYSDPPIQITTWWAHSLHRVVASELCHPVRDEKAPRTFDEFTALQGEQLTISIAGRDHLAVARRFGSSWLALYEDGELVVAIWGAGEPVASLQLNVNRDGFS